MPRSSALKVYALRLRPGEDLRRAFEQWATEKDLPSGFLLSAVGSLATASLRMAGAHATTQRKGPFEIIGLSGTIGRDDQGQRAHIHAIVADQEGQPWAGHVTAGCIVASTAELVVGVAPKLRFRREDDPDTGYQELLVE